MDPGPAIRTWLGLPPGPWPPDHYSLLALAPGTGDFAEIESRVLDRMERLRAHQLLHPEAVTEGMNRLAQALVCLTDPVARAAYDRGLGIAPPPFELVEDELVEAAPDVPVEASKPQRATQQNLPYEVVEPEVPPFEVVEDEAGAATELPPAVETAPAGWKPAPGKSGKLKRRTIYKRLAALRRAIRAWEALRPVLGSPNEALATPVAVLLFLRALADARSALPRVTFVLAAPPRPGGVVVALVRLPSALPTVRGLLPSQRKAVARDWHNGHQLLLGERARLRELARRPRAGRRTRADLLRLIRRTPELLLVVTAVVLLVAVALRRR